jgi:hypothetical protein
LVVGNCVIVTAAASPLPAQVFHRIEKAEVAKRIASGRDDTPATSSTEAEPKTPDVDGAKVLERFNALLEGYKRDDKSLRDAAGKHISTMHVSVRDYINGLVLLRLGHYREAALRLKSTGATVKKEDEATGEELRGVIAEIKSGEAYYFRMIAFAMQHWDDFKNEEALTLAWGKARREAEKVLDELRKENDRGKIQNGKEQVARTSRWLVNAPLLWKTTWTAQQNVRAVPGNVNSWKKLAAVTGVPQEKSAEGYTEDYTPMYLVQRAALLVVREFWPEDESVRNGWVDARLGFNHLATAQLDDWQAFFQIKGYHTKSGENWLNANKASADNYARQMQGLKSP